MGGINIGGIYLNNSLTYTWEDQLATIVHELLHVLGFDKQLVEYFSNDWLG